MSAKSIVLLNARVQTLVLLVQTFFPRALYSGHAAAAVSRWTGLPRVLLVDENSAAHSLLLAFGWATCVHVWMAARSNRKHAHASTALMELVYASIALASCLPLFPPQYGSSISLIGAIPNFIFPPRDLLERRDRSR